MSNSIPLVGLALLAGAATALAQAPSPLMYSPPPRQVEAPPSDLFPPGPNPGVDGGRPPGLFASAEAAFLSPKITGSLSNEMPVGPLGSSISLPYADLGVAVSPTFELGYRLADGTQFSLDYRFLIADGTDGRTDAFGQPFSLRSRLNMHVVDADYGFAPYEFFPRWELTARLGARVAWIDFDSRSDGAGLVTSAENDFFGAGVHGRLDVQRRIVLIPGLAAFGRLDGSALVGRARQNFSQSIGPLSGSMTQRGNQTVPSINLQAGLSYVPPSLPGLQFAAGYQYEQFFQVGRIPSSGSTGDVWSHGVFVRGQIDF